MKQLVVRIGSALYPMLTAFALLGGACASDSSSADDTMDEPTPEMPDEPAVPVAGDLDKTFGTDGIRELDVGTASAVALAAQGQKFLVCYTSFGPTGSVGHVARFTSTGALDVTFAANGIYSYTAETIPAHTCEGLTVQRDGTIVMTLRLNGTNFAVPLTENGGDLLTNIVHGFSTRLVPARNSDGASAAGEWAGKIAIISRSNTGSDEQEYTADFSSVGAMLFGENDVPLVVANVPTDFKPVWQLLTPNGTGMKSLAEVNTQGTDTDDKIHGAMWLPDGSILAFGGVDNDKEVLAARFSMLGESSTVEHHSFGGTSYAHAGTLDKDGNAILVGRSSTDAKTTFAMQRYVKNSVILDAAWQKAGLVTYDAPSGSGDLVDIVEMNGALYALGNFATDSAEPRIAILKVTE